MLQDKFEGKDELLYTDGAKHWVEDPHPQVIQPAPHTLTRIISKPAKPFVFRALKEGGEL